MICYTRDLLYGSQPLSGMQASMRERTITAIWAGGVVLALLIYLVGPDRFVWDVQNITEAFGIFAAQVAAQIGTISFDLLRALAIALFVVFIGLSIIALQRGIRGKLLIVVVIGGFLALVGRPGYDASSWDYARKGWVAALFLAAVGSALMTRRLAWRPPARLPPAN
jgi:hypothetical protein